MIVGSRSGLAGGGGFDSRARYDPDRMSGQNKGERMDTVVGSALARELVDAERTYTVTVTFTADRPLTDDEIADLTNTVAVQVEEPMMMNEDGDWSEATYSTTIKECGIANDVS